MGIKLIKRIMYLSGKYRNRIRVSFILAFIETILQKMPTVYAFYVFLKIMNNDMTSRNCINLFIVMIITVILQIIVHYLSDRLQSAAGYMIFADSRVQLGDHFRKIPMGYYTEGNMGKISSVLSSDMLFIEENIMNKIAVTTSYIVGTLLMNIFLFVLDYRLGIITFITIVLFYIVTEKMGEHMDEQSFIRQRQNEKLTDSVISFVEGMSVMRSFNLMGSESKSLRNAFKDSKDCAINLETEVGKWMLRVFLLAAVSTSIIFAASIYLYKIKEMPGAYLIGVLLFVFDFFAPLKALAGDMNMMMIMSKCLDRINELFKVKELSQEGNSTMPESEKSTPELEFKNVSFRYEEKDVLKDINIKLYPKTMTALVGLSGGGKSTIVNLVPRFWDIKKGTIKVRGINIKDFSLVTLMDSISMVFQRNYLFQDTIYNNIKMGSKNATREQVIEAVKKARCYEFINRLTQGLETIVGEGGASLSGGEKQRISIARCILKDAPIVILDEATANIDADNEFYIQEAISELVRDKTLLVIAHRLNTVKAADQILVVDGGRIAEGGKHEELLNNNGLYAKLYGIIEK
ncbi:MAG: ABC transporter ATP-binding protein/permease [Clostridium sp.]|uniref:ABC transporter ATP-binding protein n=1 Tax=Clostridium sp. TaxID=1506 RepID=UPI0025BB991D|nr:ABC transporter ATP-binding protein [Clostridium sp.]MCH3964475.1 ABC transporter ATP-binding protein/permease [Clostridium sp.]MCI1714947.1 ABC transporter ATP-binding protein/permease [Clostridium sp.]MCI1799209.1 ABC transporter ATP-binding protein/permease [Clostridium sp.]MCI1813130.1 ABC transporter ATP-binding protein/permease [Clostridium sp.]MCI1870020.1 ABC transporter ATP-binding protein/permease [Clostridium sp.]